MELISLQPADHLLSLKGIYKRYGLNDKAQESIEQQVLEKYGLTKDTIIDDFKTIARMSTIEAAQSYALKRLDEIEKAE